MIVFRALQVIIALLTVFFLAYAIYAFTSGNSDDTADPNFQGKLYLSLFFAGAVVSLLLFYITRFLKKHL